MWLGLVAYLAEIGERDITKLGRNVDFGKGSPASSIDWATASLLKGRKRVERILQERVPCPTRLQYDQWHSEGVRLLGADRITPAVENWPR
jgi:hypothetical protein